MSAGPIYPHFTPEGASPKGALLLNFIGEAIVAAGDTAPTDGTSGYGEGCLFLKNAGTTNAQLYVNIGTGDSCNFDAVSTSLISDKPYVAVSDADTSITAANSRKVHVVADVSADRTFTLPTAADGLMYEFVADLNAADGHDWIINTGSDTNYFTGGVQHLDTDANAAGDEVVLVAPDGNSNSKLQVNLPQPGTRLLLICNGTTWHVSGVVASATAPTFADQ